MSEEPVPEWKKNALKEQLDPSAAPFGGNWTLETSVSATKDAAPKSIPSHAHGKSTSLTINYFNHCIVLCFIQTQLTCILF